MCKDFTIVRVEPISNCQTNVVHEKWGKKINTRSRFGDDFEPIMFYNFILTRHESFWKQFCYGTVRPPGASDIFSDLAPDIRSIYYYTRISFFLSTVETENIAQRSLTSIADTELQICDFGQVISSLPRNLEYTSSGCTSPFEHLNIISRTKTSRDSPSWRQRRKRDPPDASAAESRKQQLLPQKHQNHSLLLAPKLLLRPSS